MNVDLMLQYTQNCCHAIIMTPFWIAYSSFKNMLHVAKYFIEKTYHNYVILQRIVCIVYVLKY